MKLGLILVAFSTAMRGSGAANCPAQNSAIGQSMVQQTRIKTVQEMADLEPVMIKSLRRALHHALSRARWVQVREATSLELDAVKHLETRVAGAPSSPAMLQNATHHSKASAAYSRTLNDTAADETRAKCRACAEADQNLMESLKSARDLHAAAQSHALAMSEAAHRHESSSTEFHESHRSFEDTLKQLQEYRVTYKSSEAEFDEMVRFVTSLQSKAQEAVGEEKETISHAKAEKKAQEAYSKAAAAAQRADDEVAAKIVVDQKACAGLKLSKTLHRSGPISLDKESAYHCVVEGNKISPDLWRGGPHVLTGWEGQVRGAEGSQMCGIGDEGLHQFTVSVAKVHLFERGRRGNHHVGVATADCCRSAGGGGSPGSGASLPFASLWSEDKGWDGHRGAGHPVGSPSVATWWRGNWAGAPKVVLVKVNCKTKSFRVSIQGGDRFLGEMSWPDSWGAIYPWYSGQYTTASLDWSKEGPGEWEEQEKLIATQ